jgi:hypothetical protein
VNLKPNESLIPNAPFFADLPDGEYGKGPIFSGNVKYAPLTQFISQHDPNHLRVVVEDSCVVGLVVKSSQAPAPVAETAEPAQNDEQKPVKKGPFGRPLKD